MVLFLISILLLLIPQTNAQHEFLRNFCINDNGNYTANSNYHNNLDTLLSNLSTNTQIDYGFYNMSYGQGNDKVNAIGLCRGDVKPESCRSCFNDSRVLLPQLCPNQKEAIGWYDNCMLRYSNRSIFNTKETSPSYFMWNTYNATNVDQFNTVLHDLLISVISQGSSGDSRHKFAVGNATGPEFQTIFSLVQCTPDISEQDCSNCLLGTLEQIPKFCDGKKGCRVVAPSCNFRYETYRFYEPKDVPTPSPPTALSLSPPPIDSVSTKGNSFNLRNIIVIVVPIGAFVILVIIIFIYLRMRKSWKHIEDEAENSDEIQSQETLQLDFASIMVATNYFSEANKLGQGGFGAVYKGILSNGQEVAVKRLSGNSFQGDIEFKNEVQLVAKLQHRNLVRLQGFCLEKKERLLVYEFVLNKSLDFFIFDQVKRAELDWEKRYKIIGGIARGLVYLHEDSRLRIIHRDLKASNILLDEVMNPKIADFGMARLFATDQTQGDTSRVVGTYGYMPPEYMFHGQFSAKSDVFSFGVLVLEIVSGTKNGGVRRGENAEDLVSYAWGNWREGTASNIVDPTLIDGSRNEIMRCIHIGLLCVQENVADRPNMATVLLMLNSHSVTLPLPSSESQIQSVHAPVNDCSITAPFPR